MGAVAIEVQGLSKQYAMGEGRQVSGTFYELLGRWLRLPGREKPAPGAASFWALRDVDFEIPRGEVFGIVGRNGAGKSTLLKVLSRITAPTQGRVTVRGRVASLLEVGTGFHPELTGRENIYLNATILGMKRAEIDRKLDAIVAFSGVEKFLDTPVKRYSSGMYVRLAFAVAAHVDADVLLVDEVLAVGDAEFQKRCLGVMGEVARGGRTVLFVSHNLTALRNMCSSGLLLRDGQVAARGTIGEVLDRYALAHARPGQLAVDLPAPPGNPVAYLSHVGVEPLDTGTVALSIDKPFVIEISVSVGDLPAELGVFLHCHDAAGTRVFSNGSFFEPALNGRKLGPGVHQFQCEVPGHLLNAGEYSVDAFLVQDGREVIASESSVISFQLQDVPTGVVGWNWPIVGVIRPTLAWRCTSEQSATREPALTA